MPRKWMISLTHKDRSGTDSQVADSFPVPTYLFFKGNERLGRNDADFRAAFP